MGRRLEVGLRLRLFDRIPGLSDGYFHSRPVSDMAERMHALHRLRKTLRPWGAVYVMAQIVFTTVGIVWLHPRGAWVAIPLCLLQIGLPFAFQPALVERDARMRNHVGALVRFYLDGLMGLVPIRSHGGARAFRAEHDAQLSEWGQAADRNYRMAVLAETTQQAVGYGGGALLLWDYLSPSMGRPGPLSWLRDFFAGTLEDGVAVTSSLGGVDGTASAWALLLIYWILSLPTLGSALAVGVNTYPAVRNTLARALEILRSERDEPLPDAPDVPDGVVSRTTHDETPGDSPDHAGAGPQIDLDRVILNLGGNTVLAIRALSIPAGTHVAIVGISGAGKSSFLNLLLGIYNPSSGRLLVDGNTLMMLPSDGFDDKPYGSSRGYIYGTPACSII